MNDAQHAQEKTPTLDPESIDAWVPRYLEWMAVQNYAERTIERMFEELRFFQRWCEERSIVRPIEVTKHVLDAYQRSLFHQRKDDGKPLHNRTQRARLSALRSLFQWLSRQDVIPYNPTADLRLPKAERPLPRDVLSASEVDAVLDQTDVTTAPGLRDRVALEVLYSTAVRRAELVALDVDDVDYGRGVVRVRRGKGRKDRYVPIGERALRWLQKYLDEVRPRLEAASDERDDALLLSRRGRRFTPDHMSATVTRYIDAAGLGKTGSAHMFRHTVGTLMLEHGADLRHVQEMLGHVDIRTTQIYTRVAIRELKLVHTATHPGAGMVRKG